MTALSGGHFAADFASGSVPALIPFLTDRFDLNYALAGLLLLASTASSSLVQPLFGLWSDRKGALWLIPGGVLLAAVGVGGAAVSPCYPLVLVLVFAGGLGVAAFHPEGCEVRRVRERPQAGDRHVVLQRRRQYRLRARRLRDRRARRLVGLWGGLLAMVPVFVAAVALARVAPSFVRARAGRARRGRGGAGRTTAGRWRSSARSSGCAASPGSRCWRSFRCGSSRSATRRRTAAGSSSSCCSRARSGRWPSGRSPTGSACVARS